MRIGMAISLLEAVKSGDENTAKRILRQKQCSNLDKQSARKDGTALFWSCCQGFLDVVNMLLLRGADVNLSTAWGASPLHASVDHNQVDILTLLIEFGANVNKQTGNGDTPCHLAAYRGYGECVQLLAERGANVLIRNNKRKTPLQEAESGGHYEISRYLHAVQNLSKDSNRSERSMSIPYTSVKTVTSSMTDFEGYPSNDFSSRNCFLSDDSTNTNPRCELHSQRNYFPNSVNNTSHGIPESLHQSQSEMYSNHVTSPESARMLYQSESGLYSRYGHESLPSFSTDSIGSSNFGVSSDCDKKCDKGDLLGVLRLRSLNNSENSFMNDLSSVESSVAHSTETTKPSLTFKNI